MFLINAEISKNAKIFLIKRYTQHKIHDKNQKDEMTKNNIKKNIKSTAGTAAGTAVQSLKHLSQCFFFNDDNVA